VLLVDSSKSFQFIFHVHWMQLNQQTVPHSRTVDRRPGNSSRISISLFVEYEADADWWKCVQCVYKHIWTTQYKENKRFECVALCIYQTATRKLETVIHPEMRNTHHTKSMLGTPHLAAPQLQNCYHLLCCHLLGLLFCWPIHLDIQPATAARRVQTVHDGPPVLVQRRSILPARPDHVVC